MSRDREISERGAHCESTVDVQERSLGRTRQYTLVTHSFAYTGLGAVGLLDVK
jgi:hypothetical protein